MSIHNSHILLRVYFVGQIILTESIPVMCGQKASDSKGFFDTHIANEVFKLNSVSPLFNMRI